MLTGYNINNFDLPYLIHRAETLKLHSFLFLGRMRAIRARASARRGRVAALTLLCTRSRCARPPLAARRMARASRTKPPSTAACPLTCCRSCSATTSCARTASTPVWLCCSQQAPSLAHCVRAPPVSAHFLAEQKEEVHFSIIGDLFGGTDDDRRRLGIYCLKVRWCVHAAGPRSTPGQDAYLPQRLLDKLMCVVNYLEMARVTGVPFAFLLARCAPLVCLCVGGGFDWYCRGQQVKVISQLFRAARPKGVLIPAYKQSSKSDQSYTGAVVIEPIKGFYEMPIATLDFTSLYPSIMQACMLGCWATSHIAVVTPDARPTTCATRRWSTRAPSTGWVWRRTGTMPPRPTATTL